MHTDLREQPIDVGDIIAYTASAGQSVSSINIGLVTRFTAKSIWVQDHIALSSGGYTPKQRKIGYHQPNGKFWTDWQGNQREYTDYIITGYEAVGECIINSPRSDRFLILKKV